MYWRFYASATSVSPDGGWRWQLCRENHTAVKSAARDFGTLTDCMRDAAQHGYRGWHEDAAAAHREEALPMAALAIPTPCMVPGSRHLH
jgi:hypothetical protein